MKSAFILLLAIFVSGCNQKVKIDAKYEINWAGNHYACTDSYLVIDGMYKFESLKTGRGYLVPSEKIDSIVKGCTYYKLTKY